MLFLWFDNDRAPGRTSWKYNQTTKLNQNKQFWFKQPDKCIMRSTETELQLAVVLGRAHIDWFWCESIWNLQSVNQNLICAWNIFNIPAIQQINLSPIPFGRW